MMIQPKLIIFDLNKTLIHENSWLNLNVAMGVTRSEDD
jgi:phosphoserine phosphatase